MTWGERESALLDKKRGALSASSIEETPRGGKSLEQESSSVTETKAAQTGINVPEPNVAGDGSSERTAEISSPMKGYVISISGKRRVRRLHYVVRCHSIPGLDYLEYECHEEEQPQDTLHNDYCHPCWRTGPPVTRGEDSVVIESESSSTDSGSD